jgi:hypothetical protein
MPIKKKPGENKEEFISRCIATEISAGYDKDQAVAMCYAIADDEFEKFESYNDYPEAVKEAAARGIRLNEKVNNKCATQVGKVRAQQLANGENISFETIKRMYSYLSRAKEYYNENDDEACGTISYLLWGGEPALRWSERKIKEIEELRLNKKILEFRKWRNKPKSSNVKNIMYNDEIKELVVRFNDGDVYTYFDVEFSLFQDLVNGAGVCRTEGENKWGSWFIGKTPSVGAALYNRLVKSSISYKKGGTLR